MILELDLQFFNDGEKTEEPTPKKRRDAREEGQVVQSKEINTVVILFACITGIKFLSGFFIKELNYFITNVFEGIANPEILFKQDNLMVNSLKILSILGTIILPILAIAFVSALLVNYLQVGFLFTSKALAPKLERINPIEGFKRLFSKKALLELVKSILKIILIGWMFYDFTIKNINRIVSYPNLHINHFIPNFGSLIFEILLRILFVLLGLAIIDYFFQWRSHEKNLMMTKEEIKEEYKQTEGDPFIKGKIKEKQREIAMSRMMQELPQADVIITNPTHFAIAIKYEPEKYDAPYIIAKGQDLIAQRIKAIGEEEGIVLYEDKKLARFLYYNLDIYDFIPEELYGVIAEVLAYVYSLDNR